MYSIYIGKIDNRQRIIRFWQPDAELVSTAAFRLVEQWEAYHTNIRPIAYLLTRETESGKYVAIGRITIGLVKGGAMLKNLMYYH